MTETIGNASERIESLSTRVMQSEMAEPEESSVNPPAVQWLPTVPLLDSGDAAAVSLPNSYLVPQDLAGGLIRTAIGLRFHLGNSSTPVEVTYTQEESMWYAATPGDLNLDGAVETKDFAQFGRYWRHGQSDPDEAWRRADLNQDRIVDWRDLAAMSGHWFSR